MTIESAPIPWEQQGEPKRFRQAGMLIDLRRCVGCHSCSISCKTEHEVPLGVFRTRTHWIQADQEPGAGDPRLSFVPMMCMQCEDAPCMTACPTQALTRLEDGRVVVDEQACDGSASCVGACPYGAIAVNPMTNKAEKCDFCEHRTAVGMEPACVESCPSTALRFGDFGNPEDPVTQYAKDHDATTYAPAAGANPVVRYIGLESWMEQKAESVQLKPGEKGIVYEQPE